MTTFRCDKITAGDVAVVYVTGSDPDTIGVEFTFEGNALFEMQAGEDGIVTVIFDEIENLEIPVSDLRVLFERGEKELLDWHRRLEWPKA